MMVSYSIFHRRAPLIDLMMPQPFMNSDIPGRLKWLTVKSQACMKISVNI